ncbi:MAG: hypothetical protein LBI03_04110 [Clostridiales bacterium]|jgi:hypothetical protein|nr:hypothetical protein [Clostridiales bacterium]
MNDGTRILTEIDKLLRGYELMVIETGGRYDGQGIVDKCLVLAREYMDGNVSRENLELLVDTITTEYAAFNEWKYREKMLVVLNEFKDGLQVLKGGY